LDFAAALAARSALRFCLARDDMGHKRARVMMSRNAEGFFYFIFQRRENNFLFCVVTKFFQYGQPISTRVGDVSPNSLGNRRIQ